MPFEMFAGDSKRLIFSIFDKDDEPLDMTDATVRWQASRGSLVKFSRTPSIVKTLGSGIEETSLFDGQFVVILNPQDTEDLSGPYYHEIEIRSALGEVSTAFSGEMTIKKNLIRPTA